MPVYGVHITSPRGGTVGYQGSITVTGQYGTFLPFGGTITSLDLEVDFGPGGTVTGIALNPRPGGSGGAWQVTGHPGPNVRGTQSFNIVATIRGFYDQPQDQAFGIQLDEMSDAVSIFVLDQLPPAVAVNGFVNGQAQITASSFPVPFTLSGTASDPDSNISTVRVNLDRVGFLTPSNPFGNWSQWSQQYSLPAGLHSFQIQVVDAAGHITQQVVFLTVSPAAVIPPPTPTASITSWTRLEPHANFADIGASSSARVFDPLWMLTRQWQVGEFQAEDAGSPVQARVRSTSATLTRCYLGELPTTPIPPAPRYDPATMPLEVLVERRPTRSTVATDPRMLPLEVEAALHFLRMLELQTLTKYRAAFLGKFALQPLTGAVLAAADDATRRFVQTMAGRAPDARQLVASFRSGGPTTVTIDPALQVLPADLQKVQQTAQAWLTWYDGVITELPTPATDPWNPARLEYAVSVATRLSATATDEVALSASEFDDGRFDWSSFDLNAQANLGTTGDTPFVSQVETTIPSPVNFRGAPATRFWEMEDARVAYGLLSAGPTDLAHLMMIEYASTYGNDWYVVPLTIPVGSVTRVDSLVVTDTFGMQSLLRPIGDSQLPTPYWSMWQPALRQRPAAPASPYAVNRFFLPPALAHVVEGGAVEDVLFMRDEMANMAWAIERQLESPIEQGIMQQASARVAPPLTSSGLTRYLLSSTVPDNWIPLLPVQVPAGSGLVRLKRGAVLQPDGTSIVHSAKSQLLASAPGLALFDEEVPREGMHLTRARRMTRWLDGSTWVWTAFQREVGRGEGSSGLQFDQLLPGSGVAAPVAPPPPPPTLTTPTLAQTTLAIDGARVNCTAPLANTGPSVSNVALQWWVTQGTTRRAAGGALVVCGAAPGVLPTGTFSVASSVGASSSGSGSGTFVPGAATAEVQLMVNNVVVDTKTVAITLGASSPPPPTATLTTPTLASTTLAIDGASVTYTAPLTNTGPSLSSVALQAWVTQGTTRRAAGGTLVLCGGAPGVLPTGTFTATASIGASNSGSGSGTLVPGAATAEVQLMVNGVVVDTKTVAITLGGTTAATGISVLTTSAPTVAIGGAAAPYAATLVNAGASLSNVVLQGWMHQGATRRAAGGTMVVIGGGTPIGVLPSGTFSVTGSIVASNATSGTGTLVPGPATFELELTVNGTLLQMKTLAVTLA